MGILIDTSVLIEAERGRLDLDAILASHGREDVAMAAITASELLHGVHRLSGAARARASGFVESLLDLIPVIPFDLEAARTHAALSADLRTRGVAVGAHDLLIAAIAITLDWAVATRDGRSFSRIDGLDILRW